MLDSMEADYVAAITQLEVSRSREQMLVEELQLQGELIKDLKRELKAGETS